MEDIIINVYPKHNIHNILTIGIKYLVNTINPLKLKIHLITSDDGKEIFLPINLFLTKNEYIKNHRNEMIDNILE